MQLEEPIRRLGTYQVDIEVFPEVIATVKTMVVPAEGSTFDLPVPCGRHGWTPCSDRLDIDVILLFGDCRPDLRGGTPRSPCGAGLEVGVFEEGYLRPHYMTFERHGVNGHSQVPRQPSFYLAPSPRPPAPGAGGDLGQHLLATWPVLGFPVFLDLQPGQALVPPLCASPAARTDPGPGPGSARAGASSKVPRLAARHAGAAAVPPPGTGHFFLVPLQVFNDAQIFAHPSFDSVEAFFLVDALVIACGSPILDSQRLLHTLLTISAVGFATSVCVSAGKTDGRKG